MGIEKPYFRIWRPMPDRNSRPYYVGDPLNSYDRYHLSESYNIIEKDLTEILEFIQPHKDNEQTFSHRIFELFLRACSEFEANCKQILYMNKYQRNGNNLEESRLYYRIEDYYKINSACKLSEYTIGIDFGSELLEIKPFEDWEIDRPFKKNKNGEDLKFKTLSWYDDYNKVKHDRVNCFKLANFKNLLKAVGSVQIILFAQYFTSAILKNRKIQSIGQTDDGFYSFDSSIFWIKPPEWSDDEKYNFDWNSLKNESDRFKCYEF